MPSITDVINEKYGVAGGNIADALAQAATECAPGQGGDNIADNVALLYEAKNSSENTVETPVETPVGSNE